MKGVHAGAIKNEETRSSFIGKPSGDRALIHLIDVEALSTSPHSLSHRGTAAIPGCQVDADDSLGNYHAH